MAFSSTCLVLDPPLIEILHLQPADVSQSASAPVIPWRLDDHTISVMVSDTVDYSVSFWDRCRDAGIKQILAVSLSPALHFRFQIGEWVRIGDHLNFLSRNPLIEFFRGRGIEFADVKQVYADNRSPCRPIESAVLLGLDHPSFITPAELRWYRSMGADVVDGRLLSIILTAYAAGMKCRAWSIVASRPDSVPNAPISSDGELHDTIHNSQTAPSPLVRSVSEPDSPRLSERTLRESLIQHVIPFI
ncbi:MAG: hypothetical protein KBA26_12325 [Candidatus Delongbacteria bacterium]|nr:hypothetical protein [Candidatus Delongbacteria bacterium]